jgi:hypothetical protein
VINAPVCKEVEVEKCESQIQEHCKDVEQVVKVPTSQTFCEQVPSTTCNDFTEQICKNVTVNVVVPGYTYECTPLEKNVCRTEWKDVCVKVPKKTCNYVIVLEETWVVAKECKEVEHCKPSYGHTSYGHKSYSQTSNGKYPPKCISVPKCYDVKKWVNTPVKKNECTDVYVDECNPVSYQKCDWVKDSKCVKVPVEKYRNIVREDCDKITKPGRSRFNICILMVGYSNVPNQLFYRMFKFWMVSEYILKLYSNDLLNHMYKNI